MCKCQVIQKEADYEIVYVTSGWIIYFMDFYGNFIACKLLQSYCSWNIWKV